MKKSINLSNTGTAKLFGLLLLLGIGIVIPSCASAEKTQENTAEKTQENAEEKTQENAGEETQENTGEKTEEKTGQTTFSCGKFQEYTATKMLLSTNEEVPLIVWQDSEGKTAEQKCEEATQALETAYGQNEQILSINKSNNAVCSTNEIGGSCENDLFIPGSDAEQALNVIFAIEEQPTNEAKMVLQGERYAIAQSQDDGWSGSRPYFDLKELGNQWLKLREQKQKP